MLSQHNRVQDLVSEVTFRKVESMLQVWRNINWLWRYFLKYRLIKHFGSIFMLVCSSGLYLTRSTRFILYFREEARGKTFSGTFLMGFSPLKPRNAVISSLWCLKGVGQCNKEVFHAHLKPYSSTYWHGNYGLAFSRDLVMGLFSRCWFNLDFAMLRGFVSCALHIWNYIPITKSSHIDAVAFLASQQPEHLNTRVLRFKHFEFLSISILSSKFSFARWSMSNFKIKLSVYDVYAYRLRSV